MKTLFAFVLVAACLGFGQTQIDLGRQKGVVPIVNGGTGNSGQKSVIQSPTVMNFGTVQTATASPAKSLSISIGNVPVTISSVVFSGSTDFQSGGSSSPTGCNGLQPAGATCILPVSFTPSSAAAKTGLITINSDAPIDLISPDTVNLLGTGNGATTFPLTIAADPTGLGVGELSSDETPPLIDGLFSGGVQGVGDFSNNYLTGSVVRLTATPSDGGTATLSGGGCTTNPCDVTVTAATTVLAKFIPPVPNQNLALTFLGAGGGLLTSDAADSNGILDCLSVAGVLSSAGNSGCAGTFPQGTPIIVTEVPDASSVFVGWSGPCSGTATTCTIPSLDSDRTLIANFAPSVSPSSFALPQTKANCNVAGATIACIWGSAQTAGNTDVCSVSWLDNTTTVTGVSDGTNTYTKVTGASSTTTGLGQSIYYAQNIAAAAAGARTTTFTLSTSGASSVAGTTLYDNHTGGSSFNVYNTSSITMANNNLILATTWAQLSTGPTAVSTVTGGGLTWVNIPALTVTFSGGSTRMEVWRAMGTGSSGAVTFTWAGNNTARGATISQFSGVDLTGTNGSGAIGISATNAGGGTVASASMGAFGSASNGTYQATGTTAGFGRTAGSGMTLTGADGEIVDEWAAGNVATPQQTLSASSSWGAIAIEIKASGGSTSRRDARCGEYAGILASGSPVDVSAVAVGSSAAPASGSLTTTVAGDLLTGFTASVGSSVSVPSTNFTQRLKNTFGDDLEDRQGVAIGSYNFQPSLVASSGWIASQVGWKAATAGGGGPPPNVSVTALGNGNGSGSTTSNVGSPNLNCAFVAGVATPPNVCGSSIISGSSVRFTATPLPGSVFAGWLGFGCSASPICDVTNITAGGTIRATFNLSGTQAYYVSPSGNDANAGTVGSPWKNLSFAEAHANLAAAAIIHAAAGTYGELISCGSRSAVLCVNRSGASPTQRFRIQCDVQWSVPSASGCLLRNNSAAAGIQILANNVDVVGFDYTNPGQAAGITLICNGSSGPCPTGNSVHVINNYLHDIGQTYVDSLGGPGCPSFGAIFVDQAETGTAFQTDAQVIGNRVSNYGDQTKAPRNGGSCNFGHGMYVNNTNTIIQDNVVIQAVTYGIQLYHFPCGAVITNNTIDQAGKGAIVIGGGGCTTPGTITIDNNIFESAPSGGVTLGAGGTSPCTASSHVRIANNLVPSGTAITNGNLNGCTDISGTVTEAPTTTFTGYSGSSLTNSYVLKVGSGAIKGGTPGCVSGGITPCIPPRTATGAGEPSPPDIGAY